MAVVDAIGHSPVSAGVVILCICVAVIRELLLASDGPDCNAAGKRFNWVLILLIPAFAIVTGSRIVLMFRS